MACSTTSSGRWLPLLAIAAAAWLGGCGDDHAGGGAPTYHPVPGCEGIDHAPCDVRATSCETRLFALAACLRGEQPGDLPPVTVVSEADLGAMLTAEAAMQTPDPHLDRWDWALSSVHLIAPGGLSPQTSVAETTKSVLGLYRETTKDILIVDHGADFDEQSASPVLVHELVHALQDRDVDLTQFGTAFGMSQDMWRASDSIIEGEARMHETRYRAAVLGLDPSEIDWMRRFESSVAVDQAYLLMQPSVLTASSRAFPYEWGARYIYYTWAAGGMDAVHGRFVAPPVTTRVLMASVDMAVEPEAAPAAIAAPAPPSEWMAVDGTTLGAWALFLALGEANPGSVQQIQQVQDVALSWRADGFWIYDGPPPTGAFVWRIDLGDASTAARAASLLAGLGSMTVRAVGTTVVLAGSTDGQVPAWAFAP